MAYCSLQNKMKWNKMEQKNGIKQNGKFILKCLQNEKYVLCKMENLFFVKW